MRHKKQNLIIMGVLLGLLALAAVGYFSGFFFYSGIMPCVPPPGMAIDGMVTATIFTWLDQNENGSVDVGEPPLPQVEVVRNFIHPDEPLTNSNGLLEILIFKPGCACKCWKSESVAVIIPAGYQATTPTRQDLTGYSQTLSFGFVEVTP